MLESFFGIWSWDLERGSFSFTKSKVLALGFVKHLLKDSDIVLFTGTYLI